MVFHSLFDLKTDMYLKVETHLFLFENVKKMESKLILVPNHVHK